MITKVLISSIVQVQFLHLDSVDDKAALVQLDTRPLFKCIVANNNTFYMISRGASFTNME